MPAELARRFERRSRTYEARALPTELHQQKTLEVAGRIALPMICFAGRCLAVLATPPHELGAEGATRTRALDVGNVASWPLDDFRLERAARVELASSGWKPEAPAAMPCSPSHLAGVTGFEPARTRFGDERPSHRVITPVAVAKGVETLPPRIQSGILPLD